MLSIVLVTCRKMIKKNSFISIGLVLIFKVSYHFCFVYVARYIHERSNGILALLCEKQNHFAPANGYFWSTCIYDTVGCPNSRGNKAAANLRLY